MPKTSTPLPQLIPNRIKSAVNRVKPLVWDATLDVKVFVGPESEGVLTTFEDALAFEYVPINNGYCFGQPEWLNRWFKVDVPAASKEESGKRYLYWNCNGETTIYINGQPWCGIDVGHPEAPLPDEECTLYLDVGTYQTGMGVCLPGDVPHLGNPDMHGLRFNSASIKVRNELAFDVLHDIQVLSFLMQKNMSDLGWDVPCIGHTKTLDKAPLFFRKLLKQLNDSVDVFDSGTLEEFSKALKAIYSNFPAADWAGKVSYVGHSHLDLVWMWPEAVTKRKTTHTFATMLRLMEKYPEFIYQMSQPYLMHELKKTHPEQYEEVIARIGENRWDATGGFEVEADTMIPVGEALSRALLYGQKRFKELNGEITDTLWIPDVFGYNQCLPQICVLGGIKNFYTTKMTWSAVTKFPHNSFVWQGADGSEVLTHLANVGYNSDSIPSEAIDSMQKYAQADVHDEILIAAGYGDGAGGTTEGHMERVRRMSNLATVPKASWTTVSDFFDRLEEVRDDLPVYRGELYLEYHRGTMTTQADFKCLYRRAERAMQTYEAMCALSGKNAENVEDWLRIIFCQFHDAIPGSSIQLVYDQLNPELETIAEKYFEASSAAISDDEMILITNPLLVGNSAMIELNASAGNTVEANGKVCPSQVIGNKLIAKIDLKPLESVNIKVLEESIDLNVVEANAEGMSNGIIDVAFNSNGHVEEIVIEGESLQLDDYIRFMLHDDQPFMFDAWDVDHSINWLKSETAEKLNLTVVESGAARAVVRGSASIGEASTLVVDYIVEAGSLYLKFNVKVDWHENHKLLRLEVPTLYKNDRARYGCPFGSVERSQRPGLQHEETMWEVAGSRWMAVTDGMDNGLAIITESKYGFGSKDGLAHLSLLRSSFTSDNGSIKHESILADQGHHEIEFSIGRFATGAGNMMSTASAVEALYTKPVISNGIPMDIPVYFEELKTVTPSWFKTLDNGSGYLVRLHEIMAVNGAFILRTSEPVKDVCIVDLFENKIGDVDKISDTEFRVKYTQNQIISLKIEK